MDLAEWVDGRTGLVSVDADFFTRAEEQRLIADVETWLTAVLSIGVPVTFRQDHVDLVDLMTQPVEVVLNFDFHMDLRLEFLLGDAAVVPPQDATVFETILACGLTNRYIWAHPVSRRGEVAHVYASAAVAGLQPLLARIHCVPGVDAVNKLLESMALTSVFVCRSPGYSTVDTDLAFRRLQAAAERLSPG